MFFSEKNFPSSKIRLSFLIFFLVFVVIAFDIFYRSLNQEDVSITGFEHLGSSQVKVTLHQSLFSLTSIALLSDSSGEDSQSPSGNKMHDGKTVKTYFTAFSKQEILIQYLKGREEKAQVSRYFLHFYPTVCAVIPQYAIENFHIYASCKTPKFLEIVRQTPAYLRQLGIEKVDGYSIAGRTNLRLPNTIQSNASGLSPPHSETLFPEIELSSDIAENLDSNHTVREAARLVNVLYASPIRAGGANESYASFIGLPIDERLTRIRSGSSAVQCAGLRDMWLEMAASSDLIPRVRHIGAYNYYPPFPDLISYSHALSEFWVSEWRRWVLIDPWFGFMLKLDGKLLGVSDLLSLPAARQGEVILVPLVPAIQRYTQSIAGEIQQFSRSVANIAPPMNSVFQEGEFHFGYLDYFRAVDYGVPLDTPRNPD